MGHIIPVEVQHFTKITLLLYLLYFIEVFNNYWYLF